MRTTLITLLGLFLALPTYASALGGSNSIGLRGNLGGVTGNINTRVNTRITTPRTNVRVSSSARVYSRPNRQYYGSAEYHSPYHYRQYEFSVYNHSASVRVTTRHRRYSNSNYYVRVRNKNRNYIYIHWYYYPTSKQNGYYTFRGYPYYVHYGYRHRYSSIDQCNYQLIDKYDHKVIASFYNMSCKEGYDSCAILRDSKNNQEREFRYSCAETFRDDSYDFSKPTYEEDSSQGCEDYDFETKTCYDL